MENNCESPVSREEFRQLCTRVDAAEARLNRGDTTLALIDEKLSQINEKLNDLMAWKNSEQMKPGKRWDSVVSQIISIIVAAAAGFAMSKLF